MNVICLPHQAKNLKLTPPPPKTNQTLIRQKRAKTDFFQINVCILDGNRSGTLSYHSDPTIRHRLYALFIRGRYAVFENSNGNDVQQFTK